MQTQRSTAKTLFYIAMFFGFLAFIIAFAGIGQYVRLAPVEAKDLMKMTGTPTDFKVRVFHKESFVARLNDITTSADGLNGTNQWIKYSDAKYNPNYFEVKKAVSQGGLITVYASAKNTYDGKLSDHNIYGLEKDGKVILDYNEKIAAKKKNRDLGLILGICFGILGILIVLTAYIFILRPEIKPKDENLENLQTDKTHESHLS